MFDENGGGSPGTNSQLTSGDVVGMKVDDVDIVGVNSAAGDKVGGNGGNVNIEGALACNSIRLSNNFAQNNITDIDILKGFDDLRFQTVSDDFRFLSPGGSVVLRINRLNGELNFDNIGGGRILVPNGAGTTIQVNGTNKTAIVPTSQGYRALYSMESPEVWFMDFYDPAKGIDPMFKEVTEGESYFVNAHDSLGKRFIQVWRRRKGHPERFEEKTPEEFAQNEKFLNMARVK